MSINNSAKNLTPLENFSLTAPLTAALHLLNHSEKHTVFGPVAARIGGAVSIPFVAIADTFIHAGLTVGKTLTGVFVSPYNCIAACTSLPKAPRDLELSSAMIHLMRTVESVFTVAIFPVVCLFNPDRAWQMMEHRLAKPKKEEVKPQAPITIQNQPFVDPEPDNNKKFTEIGIQTEEMQASQDIRQELDSIYEMLRQSKAAVYSPREMYSEFLNQAIAEAEEILLKKSQEKERLNQKEGIQQGNCNQILTNLQINNEFTKSVIQAANIASFPSPIQEESFNCDELELNLKESNQKVLTNFAMLDASLEQIAPHSKTDFNLVKKSIFDKIQEISLANPNPDSLANSLALTTEDQEVLTEISQLSILQNLSNKDANALATLSNQPLPTALSNFNRRIKNIIDYLDNLSSDAKVTLSQLENKVEESSLNLLKSKFASNSINYVPASILSNYFTKFQVELEKIIGPILKARKENIQQNANKAIENSTINEQNQQENFENKRTAVLNSLKADNAFITDITPHLTRLGMAEINTRFHTFKTNEPYFKGMQVVYLTCTRLIFQIRTTKTIEELDKILELNDFKNIHKVLSIFDGIVNNSKYYKSS